MNRIKGQGTLARTRWPANHGHLAPWQIHVDPGEVVGARTTHLDVILTRPFLGPPGTGLTLLLTLPLFPELTQGSTGKGIRTGFDLFGCPLGHHFSPRGAPFGTQVQDPIGGGHQVEVVLDHHHRVSSVHEPLQGPFQSPHIVVMQTGGGFIEQIEHLTPRSFRKVRDKFQPLSFPPGNRCGWLPKSQVTKPHFDHQSQGAHNHVVPIKKLQSILRRQGENVRNGMALVGHI